jgi:hypothetical protein
MVFGTSLPRTVPSPRDCFGEGRFFFARFPFLPRTHMNKGVFNPDEYYEENVLRWH